MSAKDQNGETFCQRCGRRAAMTIDGEGICEECYQEAGSCCPEFGGDDLWEVADGDEETATG